MVKRRNKKSFDQTPKTPKNPERMMDIIKTSMANPERIEDPLSPSDLHSYCISHKNVKFVKAECPFNSSLILIDISIKNRRAEDEEFLRDTELRERVRRGNALIRVLDSDFNNKALLFGRRGLPKFFDIRHIHLEILSGRQPREEFTKLSSDIFFEYRTIFPQILKSMSEGHTLTIWETEKANGENCQVSCVQPEAGRSLWLVSSKNVTIVFSNAEEIEQYKDMRFNYAKAMGFMWLKTIAEFGELQLAELQTYLLSHTFIGEYCGNYKLQHMVDYESEHIRFYAVVEKNSAEPCYPCQKGMKVFEKFQLPKVLMIKNGNLKNKEELAKRLDYINRKVCSAPVKEMGEGAVLYFEEINSETNERRILALGKLKTLEYRFFRKIREKTANYLDGRSTRQKLLKKYLNELKQLTNQYQTPEELEHYQAVMDHSMKLAENIKIDSKRLRQLFLDFLKLVIRCYEDGRRMPTKKERENLFSIDIGSFSSGNDAKPVQILEPEPKIRNSEAVINLVLPPGYIDLVQLRKICEEIKLDFGFFYTKKKMAKASLRLVLPSEVQREKPSKLKDRVYLIIPKLDQESTQETQNLEFGVTEAVSYLLSPEVRKLAADPAYKEYFESALDMVFNQTAVTSKVRAEIRKIEFLTKNSKKQIRLLENFITIENNQEEMIEENTKKILKFNFEELKSTISQILKEHKLKIIKRLESQEAEKRDEEEDPVLEPAEEMEESEQGSLSSSESDLPAEGRQNEVTFVIFFGIVALGKSYFLKCFDQLCAERKINLRILSSDQCSKVVIDQLKAETPGLPSQEYFDKSRPGALKLWGDVIKEACEDLKPGYNMIVLDKVVNPKKFLHQFYKKNPCEGYKKKMIAVVPEDTGFFRISHRSTVPFSASMILNVCHRILFRDNHETIFGNPGHRIFLALSFILLYKNTKDILKAKQDEGPIDRFYRVSFHQEIEDVEIPDKYLDCLQKTLKGMKPFQKGEEGCDELAKLLMGEPKVNELEHLLNFARNEDQLESARQILSGFGVGN